MKSLALLLLLVPVATVQGQKPESVCEVVARVNNDVITRSDYLTALQEFQEEITRQMRGQGKSETEIKTEFERLKSTVLDALIDDLLLDQRVKELGLEDDAEANKFIELDFIQLGSNSKAGNQMVEYLARN
ncbi:MAG TPA: SurA N-terminal domain-containing protein [Blastocatellia bacterium]|nr:SurA N-terminal domain-containing protein [Blastocatellia bacterium]